MPGNMLDSAMYINTYHSYKYEWFQNANASTNNLNIINRPGREEGSIVAGRNNDGIFNAHSLYLDPSFNCRYNTEFCSKSKRKYGSCNGIFI